MPCRFHPALVLTACSLLAGCAWPGYDKGPLPPPNPPVFCYDTLGRAACYDQPQQGLGELINAQLPPVIVEAPSAVVLVPSATDTVPTPAQIEAIPASVALPDGQPLDPIIIKNPDPYPAP